MKKLPVIAEESLGAIMDEVSREVTNVMRETPNKEESATCLAFLGTLTKIALDIFNDLSTEKQEHILTACGTWFDIGILAGRSPKLLVDILKRANARIGAFDPPEWLGERERAISEAEEIVRRAGGKIKDDETL